MLMSKSRLEKFLYALYSLDSSDLPTPLSRIEELYKCLVTGEEPPTFEPLSRVEKYLMAILGVYDVDSLPNPLSRVEVLLYKLATGDDNLDDVKSFLSEHEELLAEIIRNGGVGGNIDIEYVLYTLSTEFNTLYNTAEKPIKSAILKGNTMTNYAQITSHNFDNIRTPVQNLNKPLETGKQYTIIINIVSQTTTKGMMVRFSKDRANFANVRIINGVGRHKLLYTATDNLNQFSPYVDLDEWDAGLRLEYNQLMIIEGDYTNVDIPYFEGMQSVKMPVLTTVGKNLWCGDKDVFIANGIEHFNMSFKKGTYYFTGDVDTVYPDGPTTIVFSNTFTGYEVGAYINDSNSSATLKEDCNQVKIYTNGWSFANSTNKPQTIKNLMLSNTYPISYEPYKSNILTVNEDVTLRSNGDVYDELNLLTGRLTQRIDENNEVLAQEVVKTVDLSVVDQDGNDTKLSTFNDITYVALSSEGLIPEAELEVATKNKEVLNTLSLEMDDISTTQNALQETSDNQSENVDAAMMATTEIYEGLL